MWQRRGAQAWLVLFALQTGVQFLDLGFQLGNLVIENARAILDGVLLFSKPRHGAQEWSDGVME